MNIYQDVYMSLSLLLARPPRGDHGRRDSPTNSAPPLSPAPPVHKRGTHKMGIGIAAQLDPLVRPDLPGPDPEMMPINFRCRADTAHKRQSSSDAGLVLQAKALETFQVAPSSFGSGLPTRCPPPRAPVPTCSRRKQHTSCERRLPESQRQNLALTV